MTPQALIEKWHAEATEANRMADEPRVDPEEWDRLTESAATKTACADELEAALRSGANTARSETPQPPNEDDTVRLTWLLGVCGTIAHELFLSAADHELDNPTVAKALRCAAHSISAALTFGACDWRKQLPTRAVQLESPASQTPTEQS